MMHFAVLTLFPETFDGFLRASIVGRALRRNLVSIGLHNIRDWTHDRHRTCDDTPYGGGGGMVMKPEPIVAAIESVRKSRPLAPVIQLCPQGQVFSQGIAAALSHHESLILLCGHYEGIDERVRCGWVDQEISIGDFVLSGGELAAMVLIDAVARLIPGVLGNALAPWRESHSDGLLEYPHYTRPQVFRGMSVPAALLSGDHRRIEHWRRRQSLLRTQLRRPDLFARLDLSTQDRQLLNANDRDA